MDQYRVICPEKDLAQLPEGITVEHAYPAYAIVSGSQDVMDVIRKRYPVEKLADPPVGNTGAVLMRTLAAALPESATQTAKQRDYVVRFRGALDDRVRKAIEKVGGTIVDLEGRSRAVVSCSTKAATKAVERLAEVAELVPHVPRVLISGRFLQELGHKVSDKAIQAAATAVAEGTVEPAERAEATLPGTLVASFFTDEDMDKAKSSLRRHGVKVTSEQPEAHRLVLDLTSVKKPAEALQAILTRPGLKRIEEKTLNRPSNDRARLVIGEGVVNSNPVGSRLTGQGEIIGVADTGLDTGDSTTIHLDFRDRLVDIQSLPITPSFDSLLNNPRGDDGPSDEFSGHGTHVSGSVLGSGARAVALGLSPIPGMAPDAQLVFQAVEQRPIWNSNGILFWLLRGQNPPKSGLYGIPDDLTDLFQAAYDQGARIHNNSWGGGVPGAYDAQCEDLDAFVWDHPDFLIVVAAGNSGTDSSPPNGQIDLTSVDSPGTAKNCLTVGASENNRSGQFSDAYGQWWPDDYTVPPFDADSMVDSVDDVVAFSSRGPCTTGRRKPDLIAPGTFVLSTRSSQIAPNNFAWSAFPPAKDDYMYMGGTSMAAPLVAGAAALARQHLRELVGIEDPTAALLKAALIHSAQYIAYRFAHPASDQWADNEQGWGRVNLAAILKPPGNTKVEFIDDLDGVSTGEQREISVRLTNSSQPLRATLVYTDFPGEDLINNLNLILVGPNGEFHLGNDFAGNGALDSLNNVEGVRIDDPASGEWTVRVVGIDVLQGPQDFALVLSGPGLRVL